MEKNSKNNHDKNSGTDWNLHGNSGSTDQPSETAEERKLSDYPEGNIGEAIEYPDRISDDADVKPVRKTIDEATEPSKLSDI